ncbi:hypothetical protein BDZ89DRAFT_1160263 [Hymenopellis radicata]|nr:hypothetical protein BDZ89DRAFT_1160263 [Hymenopellis radicata]
MSTILLVYSSLAMILGLKPSLIVNAAYLVRPWHLLDCSITLDGLSYDVCPIFERGPIAVGLGSPHDYEQMDNQSFYQFDFREADNAVKEDKEEDSDVGVSQCEWGSWICLHLSGEPEPVSVAGFDNIPALHSYMSGESKNRVYVDDKGHINFNFMGGYYDGRRQFTRIEFICNPDVDETKLLSFPEFNNKADDVHFFTWATKYGCSIPVRDNKEDLGSSFVTQKPATASEMAMIPVRTIQSQSSYLLQHCPPGGGQELIIMLGFGYVICYPPMHLIDRYITPIYERITRLPLQMRKVHLVRPFASKKRNNHHFRVNEGRLVSWAAEDSRLLGEEDVMVNTYDEDDDDWPMDGYIPLRPGMDTVRVKNYGTA